MRLLTYNIHKGIGGRDRRYRPERIIEVIQAEEPDLVCLQEVVRSVPRFRGDNQPLWIKQELGLHDSIYQMNVHYKRGGYGNLMLSRWPLRARHQVSLRMKQKKSRGAQIAVVNTPEGPLNLVNWHLGLAERERQWQVAQLLSHRLFRESAHLPTLISGDSNDWRNLLDRTVFAGHGLRHVSHPISRFRTFPAWMPVGSLDKVYCCQQIRVERIHIVRSQLARQASDHLPVVVDFSLTKG